MILDEVKNQAWKVKDLQVSYADANSISLEEQEFHVNEPRSPENDKEVVLICCSHQPRITELAKSSRFTIKSAIVSKSPSSKGFILQVTGFFEDAKGIIISKKKREISEEQRVRLSNIGKQAAKEREIDDNL